MIDLNIQERLAKLNPTYTEFVMTDFAPETAKVFGVEAKLNQEQIVIFSDAIIFYLLFFFDFEKLTDFIEVECELSPDQARLLAGAVLASLPDDFTTIHQQLLKVFATNSDPASDLQSDIAEAEATLQSIPPVRTMSKDMAEAQGGGEVTYSTTQAAILKESAVPKPPQEIPKWDSEAK